MDAFVMCIVTKKVSLFKDTIKFLNTLGLKKYGFNFLL